MSVYGTAVASIYSWQSENVIWSSRSSRWRLYMISMRIGVLAKMCTLFLLRVPSILIAADECEITPRASITEKREIAVKIGAELTKLIKAPIGGLNLESKYESEFKELFQNVEKSDATCAMVLQTIHA
jgi:hypothetical protein